jgi:CheY-like chemotaxis protein/signal transduction histidine kinase
VRVTIRSKLGAIVVAATLSFAVLVVATALISRKLEAELATIQGRYLPKMDLGPRLEADFEGARRAFQDAVGSHDLDAVAEARDRRHLLLDRLAEARGVLDPAQTATLVRALEDYFGSASDVSRRLIGGETGEPLLEAMSAMQARQARVRELIKDATGLDRGQLREAFLEISRTQDRVGRVRMWLSAACLGLVISLSLWVGKSVLRSLGAITTGLRRFGDGDFTKVIVVDANDELRDVAGQANQMADSLRRLAFERERAEWLDNAHATLSRELRGDLEPLEVAARVTRFVATKVDAPAAALYVVAADGALELAGEHALGGVASSGAVRRFARGEGLVGRAALGEELVVVTDAPPGYLRVRSGLGEAPPRAVVLAPLAQGGRLVAVLELALFDELSAQGRELLSSIGEPIAIALEVARARASTRELLAATQRQAHQLAAQEEELRATNEELQAQEEELRRANTDLQIRTDELEAQRRLLADRNVELDEARVRLEQRAAELTTVSAYKSQFLANMSHELRTPLNSMLLLSNLLAENEGGTLTARQVEFARTIYGAGKDLLALINQVLDLAKVESGRQEIALASVDPRSIVDHVSRVFTPLARDKGLAFDVVVAPDLPPAMFTDRRRVEQVLNNLLGNAVKFTTTGGITFRVERADDGGRRLAFVVADTGIGIAPENQERVFTPFEQVDAAVDRRYGGTGLGLGIARELATLLGGELRLASTLGSGSTFTLVLPIASASAPAAAAEARAPATRPRAAAPADARPRARPREPFLLLIEDDPVFGATFGEVIHSQGLEHLKASTGEEGLRLARELRPQGIILDVNLPDTNGWRIMEALRADPATAGIPVHFVSALDATERGLALGAVGYLTKPVTRRDLLGVIDVLVPKAKAGAARILVVEDDSVTADSVLRMLEAERLEARRASSAEEALALLRRERFGCMILDLSLPEMNGLDLLQALRDDGVPDVPKVVVYTARALSRAETMTLEAYAEAIVLKDGSSVERLLDEVRLFVRRLDEGARGARAPVPQPAPVDVHLEGRRVLVVDDDMRTVYALSATLRAKGVDVTVADTGKAALEALEQRPDFDAVLMDIMMPEMDGYEAIRRIRADGRFGKLPIVALTAKAMKGDAEKCVAAGASHYLPKPIDADRLVTLLGACVAAAPGAAS